MGIRGIIAAVGSEKSVAVGAGQRGRIETVHFENQRRVLLAVPFPRCSLALAVSMPIEREKENIPFSLLLAFHQAVGSFSTAWSLLALDWGKIPTLGVYVVVSH